jgi:hypothetical protein
VIFCKEFAVLKEAFFTHETIL